MSSFSSQLLEWFDRDKRVLPWRTEDRDPYAVWVSEVMCQQTQVATVVPYFNRWMALFPDFNTLGEADRDAVLKCWEGLGYYRRARMLHEAAQAMESLPEDYDGWREVRGVGEYTAAAISAICYNTPIAAVDGNFNRVISRYFSVSDAVDTAAGKTKIRKYANNLIDADRPGDYNEAVMELGARICRPKNPECDECPVRTGCSGKENPLSFPVKTPKKKAQKWNPAVLIPVHEHEFQLRQDREGGLLSDLWGFEHFSDQEALLQAYSLAVRVGSVRHKFTHRDTTYDIWAVDIEKADIDDSRAWVSIESIDAFPVSTAMKKVVECYASWRDNA